MKDKTIIIIVPIIIIIMPTMWVIWFNPGNSSVIILILYTGKLRLREVKQLTLGHTARKW